MEGFSCGVQFLLAGFGGPLVLELLLYPAEIFILFSLFHFTWYATRFLFKTYCDISIVYNKLYGKGYVQGIVGC